MRLQGAGLALILVLLLQGCVVVYEQGQAPATTEEDAGLDISSLRAGVSDRDDVSALLGAPDAGLSGEDGQDVWRYDDRGQRGDLYLSFMGDVLVEWWWED